MALVLASGREDWWRRVHFFALFGAIGWSFGGSMSYMKVVSYCHSSQSATVLYGFAGMCLIGFVWSALGGAGVALAATFDAGRLATLFPVMAMVFSGWFLQEIAVDWLNTQEVNLDWADSDWLNAAVALAAAVAIALARRRVDIGTSLVLHLAVGWWVAFLVMVVSLGLRLNPPRGDNWAGCIGLVGGLLVFCGRYRLADVARATLVTGFLGGVGFAFAQMLKLMIMAADLTSATHVIMEWMQGAFFGVAMSVACLPLARRAPQRQADPLPRWTGVFAIFFLLWVIPYYNFAKCPVQWRRNLNLGREVYGLPLVASFVPSKGWIGWVEIAFIALGVGMLRFLVRQRRYPSLLLPTLWRGRGQLLYLVFLWTFTFISFARDVTGFAAGHELIIQWLITMHAILCTLFVLWVANPVSVLLPNQSRSAQMPVRMIVASGLIALAVASIAGWGVKRKLFGDTFAGHFYMDHIRFGPTNTNDIK